MRVSIVMGVPQYLNGLQWNIHLHMDDLGVLSGKRLHIAIENGHRNS